MALNLADAKKLKKVEATHVHDSSAPIVAVDAATAIQVSQMQHAEFEAMLDAYYGLIEPHTFETLFVPMSRDEAKALIAAHEHWRVSKTLEGLDASALLPLRAMEARLAQAIDAMKGDKDCVFVKTTCRSAKDTAMFDLHFRAAFRASLSKRNAKDENEQIAALIDAAVETLKTRNAKELIATFAQSERVKGDLEFALNAASSIKWEQAFVVRKWYTIAPEMEFRGFVRGGSLRAISQYNYVVHYPKLVRHAAEIERSLRHFFDVTMVPLLAHKYQDYIIDFAIVGEREDGVSFSYDRVMVIELNPFLTSTDALLFSWQKDLSVLEHGPFEFRLQRQPIPGITSKVSSEWRHVLDQELK